MIHILGDFILPIKGSSSPLPWSVLFPSPSCVSIGRLAGQKRAKKKGASGTQAILSGLCHHKFHSGIYIYNIYIHKYSIWFTKPKNPIHSKSNEDYSILRVPIPSVHRIRYADRTVDKSWETMDFIHLNQWEENLWSCSTLVNSMSNI